MRGVYPLQNKFVVRINVRSQLYHVGLFGTVEEAMLNYDSAIWYVRRHFSTRELKFLCPQFSEHFPPPKTPAVAKLEARVMGGARQEADDTAAKAFVTRDPAEQGYNGTVSCYLRSLAQQAESLEAQARSLRNLISTFGSAVVAEMPADPARAVLARCFAIPDPGVSSTPVSPALSVPGSAVAGTTGTTDPSELPDELPDPSGGKAAPPAGYRRKAVWASSSGGCIRHFFLKIPTPSAAEQPATS